MYSIALGDCVQWARDYRGELFHAMLCDPPYELAFMGKGWDASGVAFQADTWSTLASVLHDGAFIFAFAGTRGYHRMACAMEDAGLIIHPALGWAFGSGFPKATRIDTQVDKAAGAVREETKARWAGRRTNKSGVGLGDNTYGDYDIGDIDTLPATPLAATWAGHRYGLQSLKPAFEFIAVAQKPYKGKPVDCITKTGAGAVNIDGGRIGATVETWTKSRSYAPGQIQPGGIGETQLTGDAPAGRWPANLILSHSPACEFETIVERVSFANLDHETQVRVMQGETWPTISREVWACADDCAVKMMGEQSGVTKSDGGTGETTQSIGGRGAYKGGDNRGYFHIGDTGTAARFFFNAAFTLERIEAADPLFYCAKAGRKERDAGLDGIPRKFEPAMNDGIGAREHNPDAPGALVRNSHPCCKPLKLTQHLATLLLPPAAYAPRRLFVPFSGSGSEMIGAMLAGWEIVQGVEMEAEYLEIAQARLDYWGSKSKQTELLK